MDKLTNHERHLLRVCVEHYRADLRRACLQDQGTPEGEPGTVGHDLQVDLAVLLEKLPRPV